MPFFKLFWAILVSSVLVICFSYQFWKGLMEFLTFNKSNRKKKRKNNIAKKSHKNFYILLRKKTVQILKA